MRPQLAVALWLAAFAALASSSTLSPPPSGGERPRAAPIARGPRGALQRAWSQFRLRVAPGGCCQNGMCAIQVSPWYYGVTDDEEDGGRPHLLMFRGHGDDYCKSMEPLLAKLEEDLGVKVRVFEVWYERKHLDFMRQLDNDRCGGVPFFFNKRTRMHICGATTYENMLLWAKGKPCEPLCPPPNLQVGEPEENEVKNKVQEALAGLKEKAINKMKERQGSTEE